MSDVRDFKSGWSLSRLADEFGIARETVAKRLRDANVAPSGKRSGYDVYRLADAAPAIVGAQVRAETSADPRDLPPLERRAYYQSENERIKVEVSTGALVPAAEVEADYAELVKKIAQFFDTLPDVLERDAGITGEQVMRVQEACDRVRNAMYEAVTDGVRESA
jgi:hypothetical protein